MKIRHGIDTGDETLNDSFRCTRFGCLCDIHGHHSIQRLVHFRTSSRRFQRFQRHDRFLHRIQTIGVPDTKTIRRVLRTELKNQCSEFSVLLTRIAYDPRRLKTAQQCECGRHDRGINRFERIALATASVSDGCERVNVMDDSPRGFQRERTRNLR